jgi:hypothetical protein
MLDERRRGLPASAHNFVTSSNAPIADELHQATASTPSIAPKALAISCKKEGTTGSNFGWAARFGLIIFWILCAKAHARIRRRNAAKLQPNRRGRRILSASRLTSILSALRSLYYCQRESCLFARKFFRRYAPTPTRRYGGPFWLRLRCAIFSCGYLSVHSPFACNGSLSSDPSPGSDCS